MTNRRKPKQVQQHIDSLTRVNPTRTHGLGLWGNKRIVFGVRVDEKLAKAFTSVAKAKFGSTCNPIESFMAAVVGIAQNPTLDGVNPSITIGEIKIERNLRERRKEVVEEREVRETVISKMDRNLEAVKKAAVECVSRPAVDYSKFGVDDLQRLYRARKESGRPTIGLAIELRKRGFPLEPCTPASGPFNPNLSFAKPLRREPQG